MEDHVKLLKSLKACEEAVKFAKSYPDLKTAWENCNRPDWMLWLLEHIGYNDAKTLRLFGCWCVRNTPIPGGKTVWDLLTDERSRNAVEVAEKFATGEATQQELASARDAAWASAWDAARAAAWDAARAAAWAAAQAAARASAWDAQSEQLRVMVPYSEVTNLIESGKREIK